MTMQTDRRLMDRLTLIALCCGLSTFLAFSAPASATRLDDAKAAIEAGKFGEAAAIYKDLSDQGDAKAQYNLGQMHYYGDGVKQDYQEAIRLYRLSANQGFSDAQYSLGVIYFTNKVTPPDYDESIRLYCQAAEQGHVKSQLNLGLIYLKGEVVPQDYTAAREWLTRAAEQGNGEAQFDLGNMYLHGDGMAEDLVHGYMWVALAADQERHKQDTPGSIAKRQTLLRLLDFRMTPEQVAEATRSASDCQARQLKGC